MKKAKLYSRRFCMWIFSHKEQEMYLLYYLLKTILLLLFQNNSAPLREDKDD